MQPVKSTKELAKSLGLLRKRSSKSGAENLAKRWKRTKQIFSYLIVIDFESTCWKDVKNRSQEIIEFPAVLLNAITGEIESEFHCFVQPQEYPILSNFCSELTGISQEQVDQGIPIFNCLRRFTNWLNNLSSEKSFEFYQAGKTDSIYLKQCSFVTWSDWDLGVCLLYECRRKQIRIPHELDSWIDLRATYRRFYDRKPNGLNGALQDLGIQFEGREHSGLDDARNTAKLAWRMMNDGCVMNITKTLASKPQPKGQHYMFMENEMETVLCAPATSLKVQNAVTKKHSKSTAQSLEHSASSKINSCPESLQSSTKYLNNVDTACQFSPDANSKDTVDVNNTFKAPKPPVLHKRSPFQQVNNLQHSALVGNTSTTLKKSPICSTSFSSPHNVSTYSFAAQTLPCMSSFVTPTGQSRCIGPPVALMKKTPPMCQCGKRSKRKVVQSPGPNNGRVFFCCPQGRQSKGRQGGCGFFKWEAASPVPQPDFKSPV